MFFTEMRTLRGTENVSFELFLGFLWGAGEGRGRVPGTAPLQNPPVTSRKACLRNPDLSRFMKPPPAKQSVLGCFPVLVRVHAKGVVLCERTCLCLLSTFYDTLPSKKSSKNLVITENPLQAPSKNPSKKHFL